MKFSVACNFDKDLIKSIKEFPVFEVYGKMTKDVVGGGRASFTLPKAGGRKLRNYIKLVHDAGMEFNYLLNASCLENREFTRFGQKAIRGLLDFIAEAGVDSVTINHPLLLKTVKMSYPFFKTRIGVFAAINTIQRARFWEDEGADCICLDDIMVNRDFKLLKKMRQSIRCDMQLLVNNSCFYSCGMSNTHMNMLSHASQSRHRSRGFYLDYCILKCTQEKLRNPVNYIRASWIRPEDIIYYREIGYENFKIVERNSPTPVLIRRVKAYVEGKYSGNLLNLIQPYGYSEGKTNGFLRLLMALKYFLRPFTVSPLKLIKMKKLTEKQGMLIPMKIPYPVVIRNEKLDGFIQPFLQESCADKDCLQCRYCHTVAEQCVEINEDFKQECLEIYSDLTEELESGRMWK